METPLDDLLPIALLEEQEAALADRIRNGEQRVDKQRKLVAQRAAVVEVLVGEAARLAADERAAQDEIRKAQSLQASARRALEQGLGNPAAVEHQLSTCAATLDREETRVLEILVARDDLAGRRAAADRELADARAELGDLEAKTLPAVAGWKADAARLGLERKALRDGLPRDLAGTYDVVHGKRGTALARVVDKVCFACARAVPSQRLLDVRARRLVACDGCGRWLWLPEGK